MAREGTSQDFFGLYRGIIPVTEVGREPRHVLLNTRLLTGFGAGTSTELGGHLAHVRGVLHEEAEVCGWEGRPARARGKSVRWVSADLRAGDFC